MKIDAIIFDIGNVLAPFDYARSSTRLMAQGGLTEHPDRAPLAAATIDYETGTIDRAEFLSRIAKSFNHAGTPDELRAIWEDIFEANQPLHDLVEELAPKIPLYLLSNIGDIHHNFLFAQYPVFSRFRDGIFSYRAGVMKPDPRIFQIAASQFGVPPERTIYLDDILENVEAAKACGFLAMQYTRDNHEAVEREIRALMA